MKLEELAEWSGTQLKALTNEQLHDICKEYFNVTRPELAPKPKKVAYVTQIIDPKKRETFAFLKEEGIDVDALMRRKRRLKT